MTSYKWDAIIYTTMEQYGKISADLLSEVLDWPKVLSVDNNMGCWVDKAGDESLKMSDQGSR